MRRSLYDGRSLVFPAGVFRTELSSGPATTATTKKIKQPLYSRNQFMAQWWFWECFERWVICSMQLNIRRMKLHLLWRCHWALERKLLVATPRPPTPGSRVWNRIQSTVYDGAEVQRSKALWTVFKDVIKKAQGLLLSIKGSFWIPTNKLLKIWSARWWFVPQINEIHFA